MSTTTLTHFDPRIIELNDINAMSTQFRKYPLLDREEESKLALDYYEQHNQESAQKLILANMRYVIRIAKGYLGYGLPAKDLVQEGCIGLMKSIRSFNPHKGVRLLTYAAYWIKSEIQEYIVKNWRLVKIATTKAQRKLFFNLRSLKKKIQWLSNEEVAQTATNLDVPESDVRLMENRLSHEEKSIEFYDDDTIDNQKYLVDTKEMPDVGIIKQQADQLFQEKITEALSSLNEREKTIIKSRWLSDKKMPFKDLSAKLGISIERVRQVEQSALQKMRGFFCTDGTDESYWLESD